MNTPSLHLALRYVARHRLQTWLLAGALGLMLAVPLSLRLFLRAAETQLRARAEQTPLVLGARGSALDLMLAALYFKPQTLPPLDLAAVEALRADGLAQAIPLHLRFHAQGAPIVGTELDYLDFRGLRLAAGRLFVRLGDCVLGAAVARERGLKPGDAVFSTQEQVFNLAGAYPLKMRVTGVLAPTGTADDAAVLVDLKTAWLIAGLAHGHDEVSGDAVLKQEEKGTVANASVRLFNEVTEANLNSFHFHGDAGRFPVSAVLVLPRDAKAEAILAGRHLDPKLPAQLIRPGDEFRALMATLFRVERLVLAVLAVAAVAALAVAILVFALSFRLRRREFQTLEDLGVARGALARVKALEILLTGALGLALAAALAALVHWQAPHWAGLLLAGS